VLPLIHKEITNRKEKRMRIKANEQELLNVLMQVLAKTDWQIRNLDGYFRMVKAYGGDYSKVRYIRDELIESLGITRQMLNDVK
jgi:hypothetical protein